MADRIHPAVIEQARRDREADRFERSQIPLHRPPPPPPAFDPKPQSENRQRGSVIVDLSI